MQPDPTSLLKIAGITTPLIGLYDVPDPAPFAPLVEPKAGQRACIFAFYKQWLQGKTLHITADNSGCGGCGYWIFGKEHCSREEFVKFLVDKEGLKASHDLMNRWLDHNKPYKREYPHIMLGPLKEDYYQFLKTVTFYVNPDRLSLLMLGANYNNAPGNAQPVLAPFGSGCMELLPLFENLQVPRAVLGATDIAMRQYLPPDILAFTVTRPLFESLCQLDEKSFLHKPFWENLKRARKE
ncbi:MAG: DUF169 domain-containing protein [Candidatus Aminicenantes bacterium]|nr:DUF169 domain-containing protein [Candidatus Aminicenantes bacterium]